MKKLLLSALSAAILSGCSDSDGTSGKKYEPIPLSRGETEIANAQEAFAYDLINVVATYKQGENWVISPLTDFIALSMVSNGASDETRGMFKKALHFPEEATMTEINAFNKKIVAELQNADSKVKFSIANANWLSNKAVLVDEFNDIATEYYDAPVSVINLDNIEDASNPVQAWYRRQTDGEIKYISFMSEILSISASAVNFDAKWAQAFNKKDTEHQTFNNYDNSFSSVPTMTRDLGETRVYYNDDCEMIRLSYGNSAYAMSIFLPEKGKDVTELVKEINTDYVEKMQNLSTKVFLYLPRFECSNTIAEYEMLQKLGLNFNTEIENRLPLLPNFYTINIPAATGSNYPLIFEHTNSVKITVDEEGTVIKAASNSSSGIDISPDPVRHTFRVDRPFFYMISEKSTNSVIAAGTVYNL